VKHKSIWPEKNMKKYKIEPQPVDDAPIWEIVGGFYITRAIFSSYYSKHHAGETVKWSKLKNLYLYHMRPLQRRSHEVLSSKGQSELHLKRDLFDIIIGELHHEGNDLRAAVRQEQCDKPRLEAHIAKSRQEFVMV